MTLKKFYLFATVLGTVLPWVFFADFFAQNGLNLLLFAESLFENGAAGGFSIDVLVSIAVFWTWSFVDARKNKLKNWWVVLPAGFAVGLSCAMPLYFYLRCKKEI